MSVTARGLSALMIIASLTGGAELQAQQLTDEQGAPTATAPEATPGESTRVFSLDELLEYSLKNRALIAEFQAKRAEAKWDLYRANRITWMPSIRSNTLLSVVPDNAKPDEFDKNIDQYLDLDVGPWVRQELDVVVPIYTFGKSAAAKKLAQLGVDNAGTEYQRAQQEAGYQTRRAFWSLRLSLAFQEMLDEASELIEEQLDEMQEKRDFGEADFDLKDFRKLQIFYTEMQSRVVDNQKLATLARAGLHFLGDIPPETQIQVAPLQEVDSPEQLMQRDYYIDQARSDRPELQQLKTAIRAREAQAELAKSEWYPDLFVALRFAFSWSTAETAYQQICAAPSLDAASGGCKFPQDAATIDGLPLFAEPYGNPLNTLSFQVGLGLRWNIDPFQLYGSMKKASAQLDVVEAQQERAQGAVELEISKIYQDAADALEKIHINRERMRAAERWKNQFGLSSQTTGADLAEAVDPLKAFFEARAKYLEAIYNYQIARAELAQAIGAADLDESGAALRD